MQVSCVLIDNSKNVFGLSDSQRTGRASHVGVITFTCSLSRLGQEVVIQARAPGRILAIIQPRQCFPCPTMLSRVPKLRSYSSG